MGAPPALTLRNVQFGAGESDGAPGYVSTGPALHVPPDDIWVTANYKETQLGNMRPGQPATSRSTPIPTATSAVMSPASSPAPARPSRSCRPRTRLATMSRSSSACRSDHHRQSADRCRARPGMSVDPDRAGRSAPSLWSGSRRGSRGCARDAHERDDKVGCAC